MIRDMRIPPRTESRDAAPETLRGLPPFWRELRRCGLLTALTVAAFLWIFPPAGLWPLAFVCLTPWCIAICSTHRAWIVHWTSFLAGWAFYLIALRWLYPITEMGYAALGGYLAIYWPMAAWAVRAGIRHRISPIWTLPLVWVGTEYLRAWVMTGFPWFFLGHSFYEQLRLIQISDLTGAYGVSFMAAMVNGTAAEWYLQRRRRQHQPARDLQLRFGAVVAALLLIGTLAYGEYRIRQADFRPGPRVAVVQEYFPLVSKPPYGPPIAVVFSEYLARGVEAAADAPDLIVFPETTWGATQNIDFLEAPDVSIEERLEGAKFFGELCHRAISAFARGDYAAVQGVIDKLRRSGRDQQPELRLPRDRGPRSAVLVGAMSIEMFPEASYPKTRRYNSALLYDRTGEQQRVRYDKIHLVPFGEVVPFRESKVFGFSLHWLYRFLNKLSPFSEGGKIEYTLSWGREATVFELPTEGRVYRFAVPICYEDVMPYISRRFTWNGPERRVDFLVNISNDGWFRENELPQHLAICVFRAVENRVTIARAVNTGISGFIDPNGRIYAAVDVNGRRFGEGVAGHRTEAVRLDSRSSLYGRFGDWFAALCLATAAALWGEAIVARWIFAIRQRVRSWFSGRKVGDAQT